MNETQLIRAQLGTEREHVIEAATACANGGRGPAGGALAPGSVLALFRGACREYLACVLGWYELRDQRLSRLAVTLGEADPRCAAVARLLALPGGAREALGRLEAAASPGTSQGWDELARFMSGPWNARRDALERLLANDPRATDWRLISGIDADSILEERARFARLATLAPMGVAS